jgi:hypothetical protein
LSEQQKVGSLSSYLNISKLHGLLSFKMKIYHIDELKTFASAALNFIPIILKLIIQGEQNMFDFFFHYL